MIGRRRILIAPLDWGLGHATRCIPIIKELRSSGHHIIIAGEGPVKLLLQQEFPEIDCLPLKGYRIKYSKTKAGLLLSIIAQIPKLLSSIKRERKWLKKTIAQNKIDIVISDNRFGLWNKKIYSVFITHQLLIKSPFLERWLQKLNYFFINHFNECWVPDVKHAPNLTSELSHPKRLPLIPVRYIGPLSRFEIVSRKPTEKHLLVLLSGPEPQRSLLEKKIITQLKKFSSPVLFTRGLPGNHPTLELSPNITCINHIAGKKLEQVIIEASFIIARTGYSTVMDLMKLQKKSILIPTPGQTEQEYLAKHLMQQHFAFTVNQREFNLEKALTIAQSFPYVFPDLNESSGLLKEALFFNKQSNHSLF